MKNITIKVKIWFYIMITIIYSILLTIWGYIISIILIVIIVNTTNNNTFQTIINWFILILKSTIMVPINTYKTDHLWWIFFWAIIYWLILYSIFWKRSKFNFIGTNILNMIWNLAFIFIYLIRSFKIYSSNYDINLLRNNVSFIYENKSRMYNYFQLNKLEKEFLKEYWDSFNIKLFEKISTYFKNKFNCSIISFSVSNGAKIIKLHRPKELKASELEKLNNEDILHGIWYSINRYIISIEIWNVIQLTFSEKNSGQIINILNHVKNFSRDKYQLWLDIFWKLVSLPIVYSNANHIWIYGQTGQWKSVFSSWLLYGLHQNNKNYEFYVLDIKWDFYWAKNVRNISYAWSAKEIFNTMSEIVLNIKKTQEEFNKNNVRNIDEYLELDIENKLNIKPVFVFIEEFSYLLDEMSLLWKDFYESFLENSKNLVQIWRNAWYSAIISLQKPIQESFWSTIVKDMITPISFKTIGNWEVLAFWEKTGLELDKMNKWEAACLIEGKYKKFKTFYIDKTTLDKFHEENYIDTKSSLDRFMEYARSINSFKLEHAIKYWISRSKFDELSKLYQEQWIIKKLPSNHLIFNNTDWLQKNKSD